MIGDAGTGGGEITVIPAFLLEKVGEGATWGTTTVDRVVDEDDFCSLNLSNNLLIFAGTETRGDGVGEGGATAFPVTVKIGRASCRERV